MENQTRTSFRRDTVKHTAIWAGFGMCVILIGIFAMYNTARVGWFACLVASFMVGMVAIIVLLGVACGIAAIRYPQKYQQGMADRWRGLGGMLLFGPTSLGLLIAGLQGLGLPLEHLVFLLPWADEPFLYQEVPGFIGVLCLFAGGLVLILFIGSIVGVIKGKMPF